MSSSSCIEVDRRGLPNNFTIWRAILLSGTRIPTVFLLLANSLGTLPLALKIKVKGPGKAFFKTLKVVVSIGFV